MSQKQGRVIAFDGPDGVGKSSQLKLLANYLLGKGYKVFKTRSAGGTPIGVALRAASLLNVPRQPETDLYISLAGQTDVGYQIKNRKSTGEIILVDRSPLTIIAYQVFASNLPIPKQGYDACEKMLKLWSIDDLIVFDAPESILKGRRDKRKQEDKSAANNYFERQNDNYHKQTQAGYREATKFAQKLGVNTVKIDASPTIDIIQDDIRNKLGL